MCTIINMLLMLGWNPGTEQEIFSTNEMIAAFSLDRVIKSGARFSPDKSKWFNEHYLREKSGVDLAELVKPFLGDIQLSDDQLVGISDLMKQRASLLPDLLNANYLWEAPSSYDDKTRRKKWKEHTGGLMQELRDSLEQIGEFSEDNVDQCMQQFMAEREIGFGQVGPGFRLLLSGLGGGPSLPAIAAFIGKDECLNRMEKGIKTLDEWE